MQAVDNIVPVVNKDASNESINDTLNALSAKLSNEALQEMNYQVDWARRNPADVAEEWLRANGLA